MAGFEDVYTEWRERRFPPGSASEALDELHADLALADSWVAEAVVPFVERGVHQPARVDIVEELSKLRRRAVQLGSGASGEDAKSAADYRDYIDLLISMYEGFVAQS